MGALNLTPQASPAGAAASGAHPLLRRIAQAVAGQEFARASVMGFGSSTMEGHGVTTYERRNMRVLERGLRKSPGGGFVLPGRVNTFPGYYSSLSGGASIAASNESPGWAGRTAVLRDADDAVTFSPPPETTAVRVWYGQYSGGPTVSFSVDGGGAQTFPTTGTTDRFKASGWAVISPGSQHTITFTKPSGGFAYIRGLEWSVSDSSTGVRVFEGGHAGWTTADFASAGSIAQWQPAVAAVQPDLVVMQAGPNDFTGGVPLATTSANLDAIVAAVNAAMTAPCSWMFVLPSAAGSASPDQAAYDGFARMYQAAADRAGAYLVDVRGALPSPGAVGNRYTTGDNTHFDDKGHATYGQLLLAPLREFVPR
jgi:lysophospholipase L1-like esterase